MKLTHYGYSGIRIPIMDEAEPADCRATVARRLRSLRRHGFPIATLERGREWEIQEPEDRFLVPDACGLLTLEDDPTYERTCGFCEGKFTTTEKSEHYCCLACHDHAGGWQCGEPDCCVCREEADDA